MPLVLSLNIMNFYHHFERFYQGRNSTASPSFRAFDFDHANNALIHRHSTEPELPRDSRHLEAGAHDRRCPSNRGEGGGGWRRVRARRRCAGPQSARQTLTNHYKEIHDLRSGSVLFNSA